MKVTRKAVLEMSNFVVNTLNIDLLTLYVEGNLKPYIVYYADNPFSFRFELTTEKTLNKKLILDKPEVYAYCKISENLICIIQTYNVGNITQNEYISKAIKYIEDNLVTRTISRELINPKTVTNPDNKPPTPNDTKPI